MACTTFLKIAENCKEDFVSQQYKQEDEKSFGAEPYVLEIIRKIPEEISMLNRELQLTFFNALGNGKFSNFLTYQLRPHHFGGAKY